MPSATVKKVRPALFRFEGSKKHWVYLPDLAEIIGLTPEKILEVFLDLAKPEYDGNGAWRIGDLHWRYANGEVCCHSDLSGELTCGPRHSVPPHSSIYIPVDFSNDVIRVRKLGVIRLKRVTHASLEPFKGSLRDFDYTKKSGPKGVWRMAIVGLTHPTDDTIVPAPFGRHYPLLS